MTITGSDCCRFRPEVATVPKEPAMPTKRRRRAPKPDAAKSNSRDVLLQSAAEVRQTLRNSLVQVNTLIREVKAQRKQDRLLQTTMDSLRKLSLA